MKKIGKLFLGSALALCTASALNAQTVSMHGYVDYTNFAAAQEFQNAAGSSEWDASDVYAEFGSFYCGRTELNTTVTAANFAFNLGVRLNSSLGPWYSLYYDEVSSESSATTYFHQGNVRVSFLNEQLNLYTGKFEEWNNGYIANGYQLGGQYVLELASRDAGQHITALEVVPHDITGLKVLVGLPVIPVSGNGVSVATDYNNWKNLYKTVKFAASYKVLPINTTFNVGFRPGTYYYNKSYVTSSYFGEGYVQAEMPTLIPYTKFNSTYTIRYRKNSDTDKYTTAHSIGASAQIKAVQNLTLNVEDRFVYCDDHYYATNEDVLYDALGIGAIYSIPEAGCDVGLGTLFTYAQDTNGTFGTTSGNTGNAWAADYNITADWMGACSTVKKGSTGRYIGAYAFPYWQKNFSNGYVRAGVEVQYTHYQTTNSSNAVTYRVPLNVAFWF